MRQLSLRQYLDELIQPGVIEVAVAHAFHGLFTDASRIELMPVNLAGEAEIESTLNRDCLGCLQDLPDDFDVVALGFFI